MTDITDNIQKKTVEPDVAGLLNIIPYIPYRVIKEMSKTSDFIFDHNIVLLNGTTVFIDIVQFAPMVFSFIQDGNSGVEQVNKILSEYFTELILPIRSYGGTVYQFAGDSILVGFETLPHESSRQNIDRTLSAISNFNMNLELFNRDFMSKLGREIKVRIGIGHGSYSQIIIGSEKHSYRALITGDAVSESLEAEKGIGSNQTCISKNVLKHIDLTGIEKEDSENYIILDDNYFEAIDYEEELSIPKLLENSKFFERCTKFINQDVLKRALSGYEILNSEHREITCLLLHFDGTNYKENLRESVQRLNEFYRFVQIEADRYGGVLLSPDLSDKGNVFIIIFGAPLALERKELLTVQLALKLKKELSNFDYIKNLQCGVSTGKAYCGDFGTSIRKDYSIIGNVINIASRLMTYSDKNGILVDEKTKDRIQHAFNFNPLGGIKLKGISNPINIFELLDISSLNKIKESVNSGLKIIGREKELNYLTSKYLAAINKNGNCTAIVADAGVGKTLLITTFLSKLDTDRTNIISGRCFVYEKNTLYYMWREFFFNYFNIPLDYDKNIITNNVTKTFLQDLGHKEMAWIPLFLRIMGLEVEESPITASILPDQKEIKFFDLVVKLLISRSKDKPLIIFFEDIHWIDNKSLLLLKHIVSKTTYESIQIVYTSRTNFFSSLLERFKHFSVVNLENLEHQDAIKLIRTSLKLKTQNKVLEDQIVKSSQCNPFFIDTIIKNIKEHKMIESDETGTYYINGDISDIEIPDSIKNVILTRIDRLHSKEQVVIKTASVIGQSFSSPILSNMLYNDISEISDVNESLNILESQDLMNKEDVNSMSYMFKHMSIRDVVYQTLLQGTKSRLNLELATYLEKSAKDDIFINSERLALHYFHGEDYKKALFYTIKSAQKAKDLFASNDVISHYEKALEICDIIKQSEICEDENKIYNIKLELIRTYRITGKYDSALATCYECLASPLTDMNKALIYKEMGHIYQEKGDMKKSISICEKALKLLGKKRIPNNLIHIYGSIFKQLTIRYINDLPFIRDYKFTTDVLDKYSLQVELLSILGKIYYFDVLEKTAWSSILQYNLAEHVKNETQLCFCAADFGITMISSGFIKLGLTHLKRASKLSENLVDPRIYAICQSRLALYYLFHNDSFNSIEILKDSIIVYRNIGEMWELMTALGTLGQNYFNVCDYKKSIEAYIEADNIAKQMDSLSHQAWKYCKVSFMNYLLGEINYNVSVEKLNEAIKISTKARDTMNLCITYGHLIEMAIMEGNKEVISRLIPLVIESNKNYSADLPHIRISLIYALEGSVFLNRKSMLKTSKSLIRWIDKLMVKYDFLKGPGYSAKSKFYYSIGRSKKARELSSKSLEALEKTPYKRDYALSLLHAADCFPEYSSKYKQEAQIILQSIGINRYKTKS